MTLPQVSVIIPAYNQAHYLRTSMQSILDQTMTDCELIVVDDGSTDDTRQVVAAFSDPRLRYVHQANKGLSGARNTGIAHACAPFLLFLDADDWLWPDALEQHLRALGAGANEGLSAGGWVFTDSYGTPRGKPVMPPPLADPSVLLLGNPLPVHGVLVDRAWLKRVGCFDESLRACEDWDLWLRLAQVGCPFTTFQRVVCAYRMHEGQMTRQPERMRTAMLRVLDKVYSTPDLPANWQAQQDKAYATAYLKAAGRAYHAQALASAKEDLATAVRHDPCLLDQEADALRNHLAGWALAPGVTDVRQFLDRVYQNLPDTLAGLRKHRRLELTKALISRALDLYRYGDFTAATKLLLAAGYYQPRMFLSRRYLMRLGHALIRTGPLRTATKPFLR